MQGVQAQSLANVHLAVERDLEILPVINKIDLPSADVESVKQQIEDVIGLDTSNTILCSAKTGIGIKEILEQILFTIPSPKPAQDDISSEPLFSIRITIPIAGLWSMSVSSAEKLGKKLMIQMMATGKNFEVLEVGVFSPTEKPVERLRPGEVGYLLANIKNTFDVKIGDTITSAKNPALLPFLVFETSHLWSMQEFILSILQILKCCAMRL